MLSAYSAPRAYSWSNRRRTGPLTNDEIREVAPSVFAPAPHASRSARYAYIPTGQLLDGLRAEGFEVFSAMQARARKADRVEHTKHILRLRQVADAGRALAVGDSVAEICLINSHDGSSSYELSAGMFRLICSNGLMVSESTLGSVKVAHTGKVRDEVLAGAFEILDGCTRVIEARDSMRAIALSEPERQAFARAALAVRFEDQDEGKPAPVTTEQALTPRRMEDRATDLWTTFNVLQESLVRGGIRGRNASRQRTTTREIKGIDQNVRLNRALWTLADEMRALKAH